MAKEDVNIKVSANVAEAIQLWKAMEAGPDGMAKALTTMGDKGSKATKGMEAEFTAFIGKWGSAAAVIGGVTAALKAMHEESKKRAAEVAASLGSFGELQQVSKSPEDFQRNVARARGIIAKGIVPAEQPEMAGNMVFAMKSAGYTEDEMDFIEQIGERNFVQPQGLIGLAEGLQKYRNVFGEKDAGSLKDVFNKVVQESSTAQASVPETLKAILNVAPSATQLGMSDEETGAGFLAIEGSSPNADIAATKYGALLDQLNKQKLWRGGLAESVADIERRIAGGSDAFKILGDSNAVKGYTNLVNSKAFMAEQRKLLDEAPVKDIYETQSQFLQYDPRLRAEAGRKKAKGKYDALHSDLTAEGETLFQQYSAQLDAANLEQHGAFIGGLMNYGRAGIDAPVGALGLQGFALRNMAPSQRNSLTPELQQEIDRYLKGQSGGGALQIQIKGPDGLDIPHEPAAADLNEADPAVGRMMNLAR